MLYLDDGSFPFNTRDDMITGCEIINETFSELGLEMHTGHGEKKSKTELMYFPTASFFNKTAYPTLPITTTPTPTAINAPNPSDDTTDANGNQLSRTSSKRKLTFSTMTQKQRELLYFESQNTNRVLLNDNSFIDFTAHFKYLGTFISFDLTDDHDINNRITKASQAMGALKHFWDNPYADLKAKHLIFLAIPANLLLWGCETWALRQSHINQLNAFWHRSIRRILKIKLRKL